MSARLRFWLTGLLAGLLALAAVPVPAQHARAVLERAALVTAFVMPDGSLPELCAGQRGSVEAHGQHLYAPACLACVLMAAPGLPAPTLAAGARVGAPRAAGPGPGLGLAASGLTWAPQSARAPPAGSIA